MREPRVGFTFILMSINGASFSLLRESMSIPAAAGINPGLGLFPSSESL